MTDTAKYLLDESHPANWYNLRRPAVDALPSPIPHEVIDRVDRAALPDGTDHAGGRRPSASKFLPSARSTAVAPVAALLRPLVGGAEDAAKIYRMRASRPPAATSRILLSRRPSTTRKPG